MVHDHYFTVLMVVVTMGMLGTRTNDAPNRGKHHACQKDNGADTVHGDLTLER